MDVSGDLVAVAAREAGLRLHRSSDLDSLSLTSLSGDAYDVTLSADANQAFVAVGDAGLVTVDVTDPVSPRVLGAVPDVPEADTIARAGTLLAVASGGRVQIVDPSIGEIGAYAPLSEGERIIIADEYAYVADRRDGLKIMWLPSRERLIQVYSDIDQPAHDLAVTGDFAYVVGDDHLRIMNASDRRRPQRIGFVDLPGSPQGIALAPGRAFMALGDAGVGVVDVTDLNAPRLSKVIPLATSAEAVLFYEGMLYVAAGDGGLALIDASTLGEETVIDGLVLPGPAHDLARRDRHCMLQPEKPESFPSISSGLLSLSSEEPYPLPPAAQHKPSQLQESVVMSLKGMVSRSLM